MPMRIHQSCDGACNVTQRHGGCEGSRGDGTAHAAVPCAGRGLTQFASLLSYLNWAGRIGESWCSPSVGPGFTTILAPYNGVRAPSVL